MQIDTSIRQTIFHTITQSLSKGEKNFEYLVDSMPIKVGMNVRGYRRKLLNDKQFGFRPKIRIKMQLLHFINK
jgi:hypothetical protein